MSSSPLPKKPAARKSAIVIAALLVACGSSGAGDPALPAKPAPGPAPPTAAPPSNPTTAPDGGSAAPAMERTLKVLVLNVLHGYPDFAALDARTAMVTDFIAAERPDFVLAQELHQTGTVENRAAIIAKRTGYEWGWQKASGVPVVFEEGPAILSRWPIAWRGGVVLPHKTNFGLASRVLCAATAATPWGEIDLYSFHLEGEPDEVNSDQAKAALDFIRSRPSPLPSFLGGDTNATPGRRSSRMLRGETAYLGTKGDFVDAWAAARPTEPGLTAPNPNPTERIDYLYVVPGSKGGGRVKGCERVLDQPKDGVHASDHIGLLCVVALP